ncbi:uncharacterized protein A1O5_12673 [Cladophialophora psammophila CBS 110553]|uniref:FAD-binding FR-type domain-containing protein n=1 Tax=Cladophialophora psammophila CBS 110553 TaxID=1182543 RepID=W9VKK5_9EURO|nr:uncharacterized protein A1O5_12673 [Cladophialophora psammophila CBS 110553]EXJ56217.1 hypothetical protein A1O5_12673 [Cladophialophora psammophila CBS 110553]
MDITQWYAIGLSGLVGLYVVTFALITISKKIIPRVKLLFLLVLAGLMKIGTYAKRRFLQHVYYPQTHRYLRGSEKITRFDLLVTITFLVGVVVCTVIQVQNIPGLRRRSGLISIINIIPLSLGAHMNLLANVCGIRLGAYGRIHRWLGRVAIVEGLIHTATAVSLKRPNWHMLPDIGGLTATISIVLMLLSSLARIRQRFYEVFHKLHLIFSTTLIAALFIHGQSKDLLTPPTVYLLAVICLQILTGALRFGQILYRNIKYGKPLNRATVQTVTFKRDSGRDIPVSDAVHVHVRLSRPWRPRAGQYAYLCIPGLSHTSFAQSHPFYVAWWYYDHGHDHVVFLIERREGFTKNLFLRANASNDPGPNSEMRVLVEGPYGKSLNLESYATVLLFATGIGIAGQMPYVTQLLEGSQTGQVETRRIALFWEMASELHAAWVADMMKVLLAKDTNRVLDIKLFVVGRFLSPHTHKGDIAQLGERIKVIYQAMDVENLIHSEVGDRQGRTVVSLCTDDETSDTIRGIVRGMLEQDVHLEELDFRPASSRKGEMARDITVTRSKRKVSGI